MSRQPEAASPVEAVLPHCPACDLELVSEGSICPRCTLGSDAVTRSDERVASGLSEALSPDRRYEVLETIGRGGMGIVYKVLDGELDEVIALKVLDPLFGDHDREVESFKHELKIARRINHPNVARLFDLCVWHGRLAISQEYIDGKNLSDVLTDKPLELARAVRYARHLCSALQAAHQIGVIHRDLKLANVMIDESDHLRVLDFGIAVLAGSPRLAESTTSVFGTPWYMSPEQAYFPERVDLRSDLYSVGIILYKMVTGEVPFPGRDAQKVFRAHLKSAPRPPRSLRPELPSAVEDVILRCLAKDPADRFESAGELYEALGRAFEGQSGVEGQGEPTSGHDRGEVRARKVLIVDDDADTRRFVAAALSALDAEVVEAENGFIGVELALADPPDLILLDVVMPVLDGREALRILKSNRATADIPVVMLTTFDDPDEALLSKELGAAVFLNKPVQEDVLALLLEKYA